MIKFKDALDELETGDEFVLEDLEDNDHIEYRIVKNDAYFLIWKSGIPLTVGDFLAYHNSKGEIIKKKQEPVSATEIYEKVRKNAGDYEGYKSDDIDFAIDTASKNERLIYADLMKLMPRIQHEIGRHLLYDLNGEIKECIEKIQKHQEKNG